MKEYIEREAAIYGIMPIYKSASLRNRNVFSTARKCLEAVEKTPAADVAEVKLLDDGTLIVTTDKYPNVGRVLVEDGKTSGSLFYADEV